MTIETLEERQKLVATEGVAQANHRFVWVILFLNTIDWLTYYGMSQAFKNFMEDRLGYSKVSSSALRSTWASFCDVAPLFGAYVGDELWGRYATITFFTYWYIGGTALLAISAWPYVLDNYRELARICFIVSVFGGLAIGNGCFDPNIVTFGADQFSTPETKQAYFSHFYLTINIACTVSYAYLSYLSVNGLGEFIPAEYGYFATFVLCGGLLSVAMIAFVRQSPSYVRLPPQPKSFTRYFSTLVNIIPQCPELRYVVGGFGVFVLSFLLNVVALFIPKDTAIFQATTWIAGLCVVFGAGLWIAKAIDVSYIDSDVDLNVSVRSDLKQMLRMLPIISFQIAWNCVQDQLDANFQSVAQQSDLRLGSGRNATQIPGAALGLFDSIGVLVILPILDFVVYPAVEWYLRRRVTVSDKMAAGFVLACVTMVWSGLVETWRRNSGEIDVGDGLGPLLDTGTHKPMNNLSWLYIAVSYFLISLCECLINIPTYEIFYTHVPLQWKSTSQAIRSFSLAMGDNLASIFSLVFARYIPDDLNQGNLEYLYYGMAIIAFVNAIGFIYLIAKTTIMQEGQPLSIQVGV
ncbi:unnamed protein product [Aphanomyces euteiches]